MDHSGVDVSDLWDRSGKFLGILRTGLGAKFELLSRESLLLSNNVLLTVAASSVLLGTLYPLFIDLLSSGRDKLSVGPPYFNAVFVPLMAPAAFLIGVGPIARWKQAK